MNDLVAALRDTIQAALQQAREAADGSGGGEWRIGKQARCQCCDHVIGPTGHEVITEDDRLTAHIAAWSPSVVERHCLAALEVLEMHDGCHTCEDGDGPCDYMVIMARAWGVSLTDREAIEDGS